MNVNVKRGIYRGFLLALGAAVLIAPLACPRREPVPHARVAVVTASRDAAGIRHAPDAIAQAISSSSDAYVRAAMPVIDIHTHIDPSATATVMRLFAARGIHTAVNLSAGYEGAGLEDALAQQRATQGRIVPFCTLPWQGTGDPRFVSVSIGILERCRALGVRGLKIPKVLGLGARDLDGQRLHVDAARLDPIFAAVERLGMVVLIHTGDPRAFFEPATPMNERWDELQSHPSWSFHGPQWPSFNEILREFETRVLRHPRVTFIGAHFGNAAEDPERVARLLSQAPRYMIDTAARVPEFGRHPASTMRAFFTRWQDRIVFGTDLGLGDDMGQWMLGSHGDEPTQQRDVDRFFTATWRYYEGSDESWENPTPIQGRWRTHPVGLSTDILAKVYAGNAARILGIAWPPTSPR
ncbi:MAG: amidohydrolase family protein [Deltaproteobacteria bacterium]|nr:amidohydrolase family protein [Deltaproteobacteria bacterium]